MSTCRVCNNPDFTLSRTTGEMRCSVCGSANYVGSPTSIIDGSFDDDDCLTVNPRKDRDEFMDNAMFRGTKE